MKSFLRCSLCLSVLLTGAASAVFGQDAEKPSPKAAPMKQVPTPGRFEIEVSAGEHKRSYNHPSKAISEVARALGRAKRAKEGEAPAFEAAITLNDQAFTFTNPETALEACKALTATMRDLPKLRMGLGDLGEIPEVKPEDNPANQPGAAKSPAAAMMEVRRRIQMALQKQMSGGGGGRGYGRPRMPNPLTMQRTIAQEIQKAQQEGLLPSNNAGGGGFAGGDPIEAKKEAIVQNLAFVLGQADSVAKADEKPKDDKGKAKPVEEKADEAKPAEAKPAEAKPVEAKPAEEKAAEAKTPKADN